MILLLEISILVLCWSCQWLCDQQSDELCQVVDSIKTEN